MLPAYVFLTANAFAGAPAEAPQPVEPVVQEVMSSGAKAGQFNYTYAEASIGFGDFEGFTLEGSYHIDGPWVAVLSYRMLEADVGAGSVDFDVIRIGGGYVHELDDKLDLLATAEFEMVDVDLPGADTESGLFLRGGVRYQATEEIEAFGGVAFRTNDDAIDNTVVVDLGGRYALNEDFSAIAMIELDDETMFSIGGRYDI